jgi:hypothetical protein
MATIPELAGDMRDGLMAAYGRTVDTDKAEAIIQGLCLMESEAISRDDTGLTIPEERRDSAGDQILRLCEVAYQRWDAYTQSQG